MNFSDLYFCSLLVYYLEIGSDITDALSLIPSSTLTVQLLPKHLYHVGFL